MARLLDNLFVSHGPRWWRARRAFEAMRAQLLAEHPGRWIALSDSHVLAIVDDRDALPAEVSRRHGGLTIDDYERFEVLSAESEEQRFRDEARSTWSLLGEPWLDTDMPADRWHAEQVLRVRGLSGARLAGYRLAAAAGYVWNGLRGEWMELDLSDLLLGWLWTAALAIGIGVGLLVGTLAGFLVFIAGFAVAHLFVDPILRRLDRAGTPRPPT